MSEKEKASITEPILQFFSFNNYAGDSLPIAMHFHALAYAIVYGDDCCESGNVEIGLGVPRNPERTVALRKLLEARDAAVRAVNFQ